jgi:hypothetical protein
MVRLTIVMVTASKKAPPLLPKTPERVAKAPFPDVPIQTEVLPKGMLTASCGET